MRFVREILTLVGIAVFILGAGVGAFAASPALGSLSVTLTIEADCLVASGTVLSFGTHGVLSADLAASANLSITCTPSTAYQIALDAGANESTPNDVTTRRMKANTSDYVGYQLYKELAHTNVWGDTGGARVSGTGTGSAVTHTVYGVVPVTSPPVAFPAGNYSDTVAVTVTF